MKMFFLIAVAIIFSSGLSVIAQENVLLQSADDDFPWETVNPQHNNNIGFTTSYFSGIGFHYERYITREHSLKAVFFGWYTSTKDDGNYDWYNNSTYTLLSFGLEYKYHFLTKKKFSSYALAGARTWYTEDNYYSSGKDITSINSIGIGVGAEYRLGRHFSMNIDGGFLYNRKSEQYNNYYNNGSKVITKYFGIAGGVGLGFVF